MKRIISLVLVLCVIFSFSACSKKEDVNNTPSSNTVTVVDMAGRTVELPDVEKPKIATAYGILPYYFVALGAQDQIVAANLSKAKFLKDFVPEFKELGNVGTGNVDLEALAQCNPDIFVHKTFDMDAVKSVEALGIPTVCITAESFDEIKQTITLLGTVLNKSERATELISFLDKQLENISSIVSSIPADAKKTAIVLGSDTGEVASANMLQSSMIKLAGGINTTDDITEDGVWVKIGVEAIFEKNPDFIFCSSTTSDSKVNSYLTDEAWSGFTAVQNGDVYKMPSKMDAWDLPNFTSIVGVYYMLHTMYPEYFDEDAFLNAVSEYYSFVYGQSFDREYLGY